MTELLLFLSVFAAAYPLAVLRERLRPRLYDWPVWVYRARLAAAARLKRTPDPPRQTHGTMRARPSIPAPRPGEPW